MSSTLKGPFLKKSLSCLSLGLYVSPSLYFFSLFLTLSVPLPTRISPSGYNFLCFPLPLLVSLLISVSPS